MPPDYRGTPISHPSFPAAGSGILATLVVPPVIYSDYLLISRAHHWERVLGYRQ